MSIENCAACGGTHFGSNRCPYDEQAEKLLNAASDFIAGTLAKPDQRAWDQLLVYCPREALERRSVMVTRPHSNPEAK